MQKIKQKNTVNLLYFILLFVTYVKKSTCFSGMYFHSSCLIEAGDEKNSNKKREKIPKK